MSILTSPKKKTLYVIILNIQFVMCSKLLTQYWEIYIMCYITVANNMQLNVCIDWRSAASKPSNIVAGSMLVESFFFVVFFTI